MFIEIAPFLNHRKLTRFDKVIYGSKDAFLFFFWKHSNILKSLQHSRIFGKIAFGIFLCRRKSLTCDISNLVNLAYYTSYLFYNLVDKHQGH